MKVGIGIGARRRSAGSQVQGRGHDRSRSATARDPRVHHDQPRHDAVVQDDGGEELLPHVVRAPRARLSHRRRRDHLERRAAGRTRHRREIGDPLRADRGASVRADRPALASSAAARASRRTCRRTSRRSGNPIKLYGLNSVGLQRNGLPGGRRAGAEARVSAVLPVGAQRLAGAWSAPRRSSSRSPRSRTSCAFVEESERGVGRLSAPDPDRRDRRRRARLSPRPHPARPARARRSSDSTTRVPERAAQVSRASSACGASRSSTRCSTTCDARDDRRADAGALRGGARGARARACTLLIEKPIAATLDEADELLALADANGAHRADGPRRALQSRDPRGAAVRRRAAVHRERPARAVQPARRGRRRRARPDDPRHRPRAHARRRARGRRCSAVGVPVLTPFVDIANARLTFDVGRGREHHGEPRVARADAQAAHLPAERLPLARPRQRRRGVLPAARRRRPRRARRAAPLALEAFVERIPLEAPEGEPLRLEFESFVAAVRGERPVAVTGEDGSRGAGGRAAHRGGHRAHRCPSLAGPTSWRRARA